MLLGFAAPIPSLLSLLTAACGPLHLAVNTRDRTFTHKNCAMPGTPKKRSPRGIHSRRRPCCIHIKALLEAKKDCPLLSQYQLARLISESNIRLPSQFLGLIYTIKLSL